MPHRHRFAPRADIPSPASVITDAIIARLEAGTRPWKKPWAGVAAQRPLRSCGTPYRGGNIFWLWLVAGMLGYRSPYWTTYRQSQLLGGQVRRGEKSVIAIFYKSYEKEVADPDTGEATTEARRVLKSYAVFNADQIEGLPERFHPSLDLVPKTVDNDRLAELTAFFDRIPPSRDMAVTRPITIRPATSSSFRRPRPFSTPIDTAPRERTNVSTGQVPKTGSIANWGNASATRHTLRRSWSPNWLPPSSEANSVCRSIISTIKPNALGDLTDIIDPGSPWRRPTRPVPATAFDLVRISTAAILEDGDVDDAMAALDRITGAAQPEPLYDNVVFDLGPTFSAHHAVTLVWADNLVMPLDLSSSGIDGIAITDETVASFNRFSAFPIAD